jgi:hypothetical protein
MVYLFLILTMEISKYAWIFLFILYLFGGPASIIYMNTKDESFNYSAIIVILIILYHYLISCFGLYLYEKIFHKDDILKPKTISR